jgi:hypothetical protein
MENGCKNIEKSVANNQQGVVLQVWRLDEEPAFPHLKKSCYKMLHNSSEFNSFLKKIAAIMIWTNHVACMGGRKTTYRL